MDEVGSDVGLPAIEERVRQYLIERARDADPAYPSQAKVTYKELCSAIDPDEHYWSFPRFRGIGAVLGRISAFEHEQGRPLLSALVVHTADQQAGHGFAEIARDLGYEIRSGQERTFWRDQLVAVVRYWASASSETPNDRALALLTKISAEVAEVRRLLGKA